MKVEQIRRIANEIVDSTYTVEKQEFYKAKFPNFASRYPLLLEMCCDNADKSMVKARLEWMFSEMELISKGEKTNYEASSNVGNVLFDEYVKPIIDKNPQL